MADFDFNSMLVDVSKLLNDNDLRQMKFMCTDIIKRRDMEKVKTPLDLFTELQSREKLIRADTGFLKRLLNKCEKQNAITVVERFENPASRNGEAPMDTSPRVQHEAFQQAQPVPPHQTEFVSSRREDPVVSQQIMNLRPEFNFLTKNLSREWRFYMRALGMDDVEIDSVETDHPRSLKDKIYESLVLWVKENKEKATKAALIRALRDGSVERNDLASKMEKGKY